MKSKIRKSQGEIFRKIELDHLGREIVKIPKCPGFQKGDKFLVKLLGTQAVLMSQHIPIKSQALKRLILQRWKLRICAAA